MLLTNVNMPEYLRMMLQAAVDNAEHLALKEMKYNQEKIGRAMFIVEGRESGKKGVTDAQWEALKILVRQYKKPGRYRQGKDEYRDAMRIGDTTQAQSSMEVSLEYLKFTEDRDGILKQLIEDNEGKKVKKTLKKGEKIVPVGQIKDFVFNRRKSIAEEVMIIPAEINRKEREENPELYEFRDPNSPLRIKKRAQISFHTSVIASMESYAKELMTERMKADQESGLDFREEIQKGKNYVTRYLKDGTREGMGVQYYELLMDKLTSLGPQAYEKNDEVLAFVEDFGKEFEMLSETAQIAATFKFIQGFDKLNKEGKIGERQNAASFPPYGDSSKMYSLLSPKVMLRYNREYNKLLKGGQEVIPSFKGFDSVIREICGK